MCKTHLYTQMKAITITLSQHSKGNSKSWAGTTRTKLTQQYFPASSFVRSGGKWASREVALLALVHDVACWNAGKGPGAHQLPAPACCCDLHAVGS